MTRPMIADKLKHLIAHIVPYRWVLMLAVACLLVESAASLAIPWLAGQLIVPLLQKPSDLIAPFTSMALLLLGLCSVQALGSFGMLYFTSRTADQLFSDLRAYVYDHVQALPLDFYRQRREGEILNLLTYDEDNNMDIMTTLKKPTLERGAQGGA